MRTTAAQPAVKLGTAGLVAGREIRERIRGRAFRIATLIGVVAIIAAIVIPTFTSGSKHVQRIGVIGVLSPSVRAQISGAARSAGTPFQFVVRPNRSVADEDLLAGSLDLAVVDSATVLLHKSIGTGDTSTTARLARTVAQILGTDRAAYAAGLTPAQVGALAAARPVPIRGLAPASNHKSVGGAPITGLILVFILLSQYLGWTLVGVMQEKANRVVEVLLATVRPLQLLVGKLLGIGAVVFAQAAVFTAAALIAAEIAGSNVLRSASPAAILSQLVWLVLGYAFYSWLYAAAGSMAERQDQVQTLAIPLTIPMVFGYVVAISAAGSGQASTLLRVLAYLPPTAPFAAPILVALSAMTWWQFVLSIAISVGSTLAVARLAAAVYRRAILRTGRRVRFRELFRSEKVAAHNG